MHYNETTPAPSMTEAQALATDLRFDDIARKIERNKGGKLAKLGGLISNGESHLGSAQGLVETVMTNEGMKIGKDYILSLLAPAKDVVAILDLLAQVHPAVGVAAGVIKVLVSLEMDRQDNDKKIAALFYAMADMLFVLSYLDPVFKDNDGLQNMLKNKLAEIIDCMKEFGNFCDLYYKHKSYVRMIFSSKYKGKLAGYIETFGGQKAELKFLVQQKTAVTVVAMKSSLESVSEQVTKISALLEAKSSEEKRVAEMVRDAGGEAALLNNNEAIEKIVKALNRKLDPSIMYTMRADLDTMLKSNAALFELKMKQATAEIKDAIDQSTAKILLRLEDGPHDLIEDPDIRAVWKAMQWRLSCKVRPFVDAVHLHYMQLFTKHERDTGDTHPDHWTLLYMSKVVFHPAIGNAIDHDSSGFISVFETNRFFHKKPHGWSSPQWLAYWAVGWYKNAIAMQKRCMDLLDSVESSLDRVLPLNSRYLSAAGYHETNLWEMRLLVESFYSQPHGYLEEEIELHEILEKLRVEKQVSEIKAMKFRLQKLKYQLDDRDSVAAVCRSQQIEVKLLSLIYLMLKRHAKIIDLASKMILDEQEFWTMSGSLQNITKACHFRLRTLLECWRQQRLDTSQQLRAFSSGMFQVFYREFFEENVKNAESSEDNGTEDSSEDSIEDYVIEDAEAIKDNEDVLELADEAIWKQATIFFPQTEVGTAGTPDGGRQLESHRDDSGEGTTTDFDGREYEISCQNDVNGNDHIPLLCCHDDEEDSVENLLVYPVPTQQYGNSDTARFNQEAIPDKSLRMMKKQTKEKKLEERILAAEIKLAKIEQILEAANLGRIEPLLLEVLSITKPLAQKCAP